MKNKKLTENARKNGIMRGSGPVLWRKTIRLPFHIYITIMRRGKDVFETLDNNGGLVRCDKYGNIMDS